MLNHEWANGAPSNDLHAAGILIHTFDSTEDTSAARLSAGGTGHSSDPWMPCPQNAWCGKYGDRISSSIINHALPHMFTWHAGGMVLSPKVPIHCSYFHDGGTMEKLCPPPGAAVAPRGCVPGCSTRETGKPNFCVIPPDLLAASANLWDCAFAPSDTEAMLRKHVHEPWSYNEVVVNVQNWTRRLPDAVRGFFYVSPKSPSSSDLELAAVGEGNARAAHRRFNARYPHVIAPLVRLNLKDPRKALMPFEVAPEDQQMGAGWAQSDTRAAGAHTAGTTGYG